jgi:hypothetical protein
MAGLLRGYVIETPIERIAMEHMPPETQEDAPTVVTDGAATADSEDKPSVAPDRPGDQIFEEGDEKSGDTAPQS